MALSSGQQASSKLQALVQSYDSLESDARSVSWQQTCPLRKGAQHMITYMSGWRQQNKALCGSWALHRAGKTEYGVTNDDVDNV